MPSAVRSIKPQTLLFPIVLLLIWNISVAETVLLDDQTRQHRLLSNSIALEDPESELTALQVLERMESDPLTRIPSESVGTLWVAFQVKPSKSGLWSMHFHNMLYQELELFAFTGGDKRQLYYRSHSGMKSVIEGQEQNLDLHYSINLPLMEQETTVLLLRISAPLIHPPLMVMLPPQNSEPADELRTFLILLGFGVILGLAMYNLILGLATSDSVYYLYALHAVTFLALFLDGFGLLAQLFSIGDPSLHIYISALTMHYLVSLLFAYRFLDIGKRSTTMLLPFLLLGAALGILLLLTPFIAVHMIIPVLRTVIVLEILLLIIVALDALLKHYRPARYYLAGWAVIAAAHINTVLSFSGLIEYTRLDTEFFFFAAVLEMFLFSLALGDRIRVKELGQSALEAAAKAQSAFLATMSHEIRTPLTAIIGGTELLEREGVSEGSRRYINSIRSAGEILLGVVNNILEFSKLEAGPLKLYPRTFSPNQLVGQVCDVIRPRAEAKGLKLSCQFTGDLPAQVMADRDYLRQVLVNLADNALKFTDSGEIVFRIDTERQHGVVKRLIFTVEDSGRGIDSTDQKRMFQRFTQVHRDRNGNIGGTGLGLAICKRLVESMGGQIEVESRLGEGTRISFDIEVSEDMAKSTTPAREKCIAPSVLANLSVLVVDDVAINREFIIEVIRPDIRFIDAAANGADALQMWRSNRYDLILLDVMMPGLDGVEFVQQVRRSTPSQGCNVPIIGVTASVESEQCQRYLDSGMNAVIAKPFTKKQLMSAMAEVFAKSRPSVLIDVDIDSQGSERQAEPNRERYLARFAQVGREYMLELSEAVSTQVLSDIEQQAHRLAGAAAVLQLSDLASAARQLEKVAREQRSGEVEAMFAEVQLQWRVVMGEDAA